MRQRDASYSEIADAIGSDAARALVAKHGGTTLLIPADLKPGTGISDDLIATLGEPAARSLVKYTGRLYLYIPRNAVDVRQGRDKALQERFDAMTTGPDAISARKAVGLLAREFSIVDSTVWRILKRGIPA
jgi:hypothetical protein